MKSRFRFIGAIGIFAFSGATFAKMPNGQLPIRPDDVLSRVDEMHWNALGTLANIGFQASEIKQIKVLMSGLFSSGEVSEITAASHCSLPDSQEITDWATTARPVRHGFYWIANKAREIGFAYYMHLPSMKVVEFGNSVFPAYLLMVCNKK